MKTLHNILVAGALVGLTSSCMDIGAAMFAGRDAEYEFTNDRLPEAYWVDEDALVSLELASDDEIIHALYVGDISTIDEDTVILYLHGNAPSMNSFWEPVAHLANLVEQHHYGVMMYDYRGYGKSTGNTQNAATMAADYHAVVEWLQGQGLDSDRLVVMANSLGSLPAGPAAAGESLIPIQKLIMEVPQSSADAIIQDATGLSLPASMITEYTFDLGKNMADYSGELLWMHGTEDAVAPFVNAEAAMGENNASYYDVATYEGAGHGLRSDIGPEVWGERILNFIRH